MILLTHRPVWIKEDMVAVFVVGIAHIRTFYEAEGRVHISAVCPGAAGTYGVFYKVRSAVAEPVSGITVCPFCAVAVLDVFPAKVAPHRFLVYVVSHFYFTWYSYRMALSRDFFHIFQVFLAVLSALHLASHRHMSHPVLKK